MIAHESLKDIAKEIEATGKPKRIRVRRLLAIVGQERRGKHVTRAIRRLLRRHRLKCHPDFANVHIDSPVSLTLGPKLGRPPMDAALQNDQLIEPIQLQGVDVAADVEDEIEPHLSPIEIDDEIDVGEIAPETDDGELAEEVGPATELEEREVVVTIRKGIPAGGRAPMLVRRNETVHRALTQMIDNDFSQLVVANSDHARVEGIFSWQSYGQAILAGRQPERVQDCMSHNFAEVNEEKPLFDAVREVIRHHVLVVRSKENRLCGLVTQLDVAEVFIDLAEPFLFLGQIENHLRDLVERMRLTPQELHSLADERDITRADIERVDDLTLGELIRAIQNPEFWQRLGLNHDRTILLNRLERVRKIRNRIMHFDADGIAPPEKCYLKETRRILQEM
jgi:predicted transcriptional regulator